MSEVDYTRLSSTPTEVDVIGSIVMDVDVYYYVRDMLSRDIFQDYECLKAYEVIEQVVSEGKIPDWQELDARLKKHNVNIMNFITGNTVSYEVTRQRIEFLRDLSYRRRLSALFYKGQVLMTDVTTDSEDVHLVLKELTQAANYNAGEKVQTFGEGLQKLLNHIADRKEDRGEVGMMTGLRIFDSRYGWHGGDLVIIAGATSQGKSTLATTIAYNMAVTGVGVLFFSMEMSMEQLIARIIARQVRVSSSTSLYQKMSDDEYNRVYDGSLGMMKLPIYFDEDSKTSFVKICSSIRTMVKAKGVRVVFIDYLQILANGRGDNREQVIGDMARDLKRLAVELNICIVALSQLARAAGQTEPNINRMRGSGQIEEACDIAVLIHRPNPRTENAKIYIAKGRNIGLAQENVKFNTSLSYFSDYEEGDPNAPYEEKKEKLPF